MLEPAQHMPSSTGENLDLDFCLNNIENDYPLSY